VIFGPTRWFHIIRITIIKDIIRAIRIEVGGQHTQWKPRHARSRSAPLLAMSVCFYSHCGLLLNLCSRCLDGLAFGAKLQSIICIYSNISYYLYPRKKSYYLYNACCSKRVQHLRMGRAIGRHMRPLDGHHPRVSWLSTVSCYCVQQWGEAVVIALSTHGCLTHRATIEARILSWL